MKFTYTLTAEEEAELINLVAINNRVAPIITPEEFLVKILKGHLGVHIARSANANAKKLTAKYSKLSTKSKEAIDSILGD